MIKKMHLKSLPNKRRQSSKFQFKPADPTMFFRTIILFGALLVATVAILYRTTDEHIWNFLGIIVLYAALTGHKAD